MNNQIITGIIKSSSLSATIYGGMSPGESQSVLIPKTISQNGVYAASDDNADGYSAVTVNVQSESTSFVMREKDNILKYNKVYLNDVYAVYAQDLTTQQSLEHLQNGSFLTGSGTIWKMSGGAIQTLATNWYRAMTFTEPITLTNETNLKIKCGYNTSSTWRNLTLSFWESVNPSTILAQGFSTGSMLGNYESIVTNISPAQSPSTVYTIDVSALQGKTIWIHFFSSDLIPLITEIWFE